MADREIELIARLAPGVVGDSTPRHGTRSPAGDPFLSHAFLAALEEFGKRWTGDGLVACPDPDRGSVPAPLRAARPPISRRHSQGEYVFDHGWADAWERAGGQYYPKLQIAVPFTPVPGPRLLGDRASAAARRARSGRARKTACRRRTSLSSTRRSAAECRAARLADPRTESNIHWHNRGYASFDDFLGALDQPQAQGDPQGAGSGASRAWNSGRCAATKSVAAEWDAIWRFYQDTGAPQMGPALSDPRASSTWSARAWATAACCSSPCATAGRSPARSTSSAPETLYGRYWGAVEEVPFLHFELCYYQAIEWAIEQGLASVQAGAQGEHKLARGYEPVITRSAHFMPNSGFRQCGRRLRRARADSDGG